MRKVIFFISPVLTALGVYLLLTTFVFKTHSKGGLQVTATPQATVYLNEKEIGKTPLCNCDGDKMIPSGTYTIKLVPSDGSAPYEEKIPVNPNVITVVDRTFGQPDAIKGSIITLTKINSPTPLISVITFPLDASVSVDGNVKGVTPLTLSDITPSDHELLVSKEGYAPSRLRIHAVEGYKMTVTMTLPVDLTPPVASASSLITPSVTPTATPSAKTVTILSTPTGFLRVRDQASISGAEIAQVKPGEVFPYTDEKTGWTQITLSSGVSGWVNNQYIKKSTPE